MIEAAIAAAAAAVLLGVMWWRDARGASGWDDLLAPDMLELQDMIAKKFEADQRFVQWAGEDRRYVAGIVPGRVAIIRRLVVYQRIVAAAAPPPSRLGLRLGLLKRGFQVLARPSANIDELASLDREALEACRALTAAAGAVERRDPRP